MIERSVVCYCVALVFVVEVSVRVLVLMVVMRELGIAYEKFNVYGGVCVLGYFICWCVLSGFWIWLICLRLMRCLLCVCLLVRVIDVGGVLVYCV